ncbi:MAG: hypothetical protein AAFU53_01310 [Cyanobacteria bacterium J06632_3]
MISSLYQNILCLRAVVDKLKSPNFFPASTLTTLGLFGLSTTPLNPDAWAHLPVVERSQTVSASWLAAADGSALPELLVARDVDDSRDAGQERLRRYLQRLLDEAAREDAIDRGQDSAEREATGAAESTAVPFPSLGSAVFDEQLARYVAYLEMFGVPDILIVGSSRALQGIDPEVLQTRLASQGYPDIRAYNFSVNGATAQVVNFILAELLPGDLPAVVVWGDGSRAFNDGRRDRTWESLIASPGYRAIAQGQRPAVNIVESVPANRFVPSAGVSGILDGLGFSAVGDRFDPAAYYRQFPRVSGRYDGAYSPFSLEGAQSVALAQVASVVRQQNSQLLFVNLPLSSSYLDEFRLYHEGEFQSFLQTQSTQLGFGVVDLLTQWEGQPGFFADPSHINQHGAAAISDQLARDPQLLLALISPDIEAPVVPAIEMPNIEGPNFEMLDVEASDTETPAIETPKY